MKKKIIIIISIIVILIVAGVVGISVLMPVVSPVMGNVAVVTKVADLNGNQLDFSSNRYSGVVEMKDIVSIKADDDKIIKNTYVKEGDTVKKDDKLFEYDVEQMELQRSQYQLDLDQAQSEISLSNSQITALEKEKNSANQNERLSIESQILALKMDIKRAEYTVTTSTKEIEKLDKDIKNNVVKAKSDGKIKSVGYNTVEEDPYGENAYIKMATNDNLRIKTTISEEHIDSFSKDSPVIVRSRIDETQIWKGKVTSVDTTAPIIPEDSMGVEGDTKYPVYIELDNTDGLLIGQHVAVELDVQEDTATNKLELAEFYISDIDTAPYVWCMDENSQLVKRTVELGEYNELDGSYEIVSGITNDDYIAFPDEGYEEGMGATVLDIPAELLGEMESAEVIL
jgi:HlyD family secretion protein